MNTKLKNNINKSVEILRKYRQNAIDRKNVNAQKEVEIVMHTLNDVCKIIWSDD